MTDILTLLECFAPHLSAATIRQLSQIIVAIITMSGRVTMLGMSRWTDKGGSYRRMQRFFSTVIPWSQVFWMFFVSIYSIQKITISWSVMKVW